jgi:hypothetical protein
MLARELRTNAASVSSALIDASVQALEILQAEARGPDDVLQLLIDAIDMSEQPTLLCALDGAVLAVNAVAEREHVVPTRLVVHVTDVLIGGDAVWNALRDSVGSRRAVVVVPTVSALVCAWRLTRRDDLLILVAEFVGAADAADLFAKRANADATASSSNSSSRRSSAPKLANSMDDSSADNSNNSSDSSDDDSTFRSSDESRLRILAGKSSSGRSASPTQQQPAALNATGQPTAAPVVTSASAQSSPRVPSPSPSPSDSSRSSATMMSSRSQDKRKHALRTTSGGASKASRLITRAVVFDFATEPMTVRSVLYSGPLATVVRASIAGFDVAAKITPTRYMSNEEKVELRNTMMLAATLQHRNIVRQLGFNLSATNEWVEYIELCDKSLEEHIRKAPVTIATVHQALQVAQALHYMHGKGIMHRDVKSKNVLVRMIDGEAVMKLSDCGDIAVIVAGSSYRTGVGTPEFMAPEVVAVATVRFRAYGSPCDIWSYGMLLFELLTGGDVPYSDVSRWKLGETIAAGVRPTLPLKTDRTGSAAEAQLIELFVDCTRVAPAERLTASAACSRLEKLLKMLS